MFAELFAKTNYSFLEGASHPEEMVERARELGYHSLAIVDTLGVYGAPRAFAAARKTGFPLLIGAEAIFPSGKTVVLLALGREGYGNLCEWLTAWHQASARAPISWESLEAFSKGLFCLLPVLSLEEEKAPWLKEVFGDRIALLASRFLDGKDAAAVEKAEHYARHFGLP